MRRLVLSADQKNDEKERKFCPHIVGCRSIVGEGLHLGKVRQLMVSRDVSVVPKRVPMEKVGYDKLQLIVLLFVGMWIIFIKGNGGEYFCPFL